MSEKGPSVPCHARVYAEGLGREEEGKSIGFVYIGYMRIACPPVAIPPLRGPDDLRTMTKLGVH